MASSKRGKDCSRRASATVRVPFVLVLFAGFLAQMISGPTPAAAQQAGGFLSGIFGNGSAKKAPKKKSPQSNRSGNGIFAPFSDILDLDNLTGDNEPKAMPSRFRTLCVRMCDGYYFPISYSTSQAGLANDAKQCQARCGSPAKLFYHPNPGSDVDQSRGLDGQPYTSLANAFRYRSELVEGCGCKPDPWSEAAQQEYERRAELAANPELAAQQAAQADQSVTPVSEVAGWSSRSDGPPQSRKLPSSRRYVADERSRDDYWGEVSN